MAENFVRRNIGFEGILVGPFKQGLTGKQNLKVEYFIKDKKGTHACTSYSTEKTKAADTILKRKPGDKISCQGDISDDGRVTIWVIADEEQTIELGAKLRAEAKRKTSTDDVAKEMRAKGYVRLYSKEIAGGFWAYSWLKRKDAMTYGKIFEGRWYSDEAYEKLIADREEAMRPSNILGPL